MKASASRKKGMRSQPGFALPELMIAIVISALLVVGVTEIMRQLVVVSAEDRAETRAILQLQYVGFWITEDVVQARADGVSLGDTRGFPLVVEWTEWDGDMNQVIYSIEGEDTWRLTREHKLKPNGATEFTSYGSSLVGESLAYNDRSEGNGTICYWLDQSGTELWGNVTDILVVEVAADVDYGKGDINVKRYSRRYEIYPRSS